MKKKMSFENARRRFVIDEPTIGHVRKINILTWLRGFQSKLLYVVLFSLCPSFWYPGCQRSSRSPAARSFRASSAGRLRDSASPLNSVAPNEKKTSGTQGKFLGELRDKETLKKLQFLPESPQARLEY